MSPRSGPCPPLWTFPGTPLASAQASSQPGVNPSCLGKLVPRTQHEHPLSDHTRGQTESLPIAPSLSLRTSCLHPVTALPFVQGLSSLDPEPCTAPDASQSWLLDKSCQTHWASRRVAWQSLRKCGLLGVLPTAPPAAPPLAADTGAGGPADYASK